MPTQYLSETAGLTVVSVADMKVSRTPGETLVTYSLGSCLGISAFDPLIRAGGLLHVMLPSNKTNPAKAKRNPFVFVDTGLPLFFNALEELGANRRRLILKVAGGARSSKIDFFDIGKRNLSRLKKLAWKYRLKLSSQCTGGRDCRTLYLDIDKGRTWVRTLGDDIEL